MALLLSRLVFKHPFPSIWWQTLREDRFGLPSYTQAYTRGLRLLDRLEAVASPARGCTEVIIDSMPLPVCRPKRVPNGVLERRVTGTATSSTPG